MARPKGTTKDGIKFLNELELKEFTKAVKRGRSPRDYLMFGLILRLGLRVAELCNIKLEDIKDQQIIIQGLKNGRLRMYDLVDNNGAYRPDRENELWRKLKEHQITKKPKRMGLFLFQLTRPPTPPMSFRF